MSPLLVAYWTVVGLGTLAGLALVRWCYARLALSAAEMTLRQNQHQIAVEDARRQHQAIRAARARENVETRATMAEAQARLALAEHGLARARSNRETRRRILAERRLAACAQERDRLLADAARHADLRRADIEALRSTLRDSIVECRPAVDPEAVGAAVREALTAHLSERHAQDGSPAVLAALDDVRSHLAEVIQRADLARAGDVEGSASDAEEAIGQLRDDLAGPLGKIHEFLEVTQNGLVRDQEDQVGVRLAELAPMVVTQLRSEIRAVVEETMASFLVAADAPQQVTGDALTLVPTKATKAA